MRAIAEAAGLDPAIADRCVFVGAYPINRKDPMGTDIFAIGVTAAVVGGFSDACS